MTVLIHLPVPINPAIVGVLIPPIALLALATGQNPAMYTLPVAFTASCAMLLPLDAVAVITIDRPDVANAIDRPTAAALADAFPGASRPTSHSTSPCSPERTAPSAPAPT